LQLEQHLKGLPELVRQELTMVAAELVENGLLHADPSDVLDNVVLQLERTDSYVELSVRTLLRVPERAHGVLRRVREIEAADDKARAYVDRLLELSRAPRNSTSELGFHRIATEGQCRLHAEHVGDHLTIRARRAL
jgi:hypothetical protein